MATALNNVTAAAYVALEVGPKDVYLQNRRGPEILYRVNVTGVPAVATDGHILGEKLVHPVRIPTGSSLYARVAELASDKTSVAATTETYLGPE